ncbi:MAG: hypothetical protein H7Z37_14550, partial [Pyrinomonadaceae bacterium]|nr:hypothetical protein [Pyrinomonadaceae bacterium]
NLSKLVESQPENREILAKLAQLDEQLSRFDDAEKNLVRLAGIDFAQNENLANFYHRRAQFENEAKVLRKILFAAAPEKRAATFERLIDLARVHDLKAYLNQEFYAEVVKQNPDVSDIFERLIEKLVEEKNYVEALNFVRQARARFPERAEVLLDKEISILLETNQTKEAVIVYKQSFDPFWSDSKTSEFYQFLSDQDQLRLYGAELKNRIKQNPADFDATIRYALYRKHDYSSGDDEIAPVILKLEGAKTAWTMEELVTVTRILLKENEGEMASRFLYTLYLRDDFKANKDLRAKVLYQLFEMFSDAESQRLPITKGDLRFYEDVAQADTNPGITTGILSLIFSDTNPRRKLENQETQAIEHFNRAAAHRIFIAYKAEFQTSPELAQMYLDIVRLYTATKDTETAERTLNEFASKYDNSTDFPAVALKLADAFAATKQTEKQRETYQKILDYLGKQGKTASPETRISRDEKSNRNAGINIPAEKKDGEKSSNFNSYYSTSKRGFRDYIGRKNLEITYSEVLETLVESFAKQKDTSKILELYSREIRKYPGEEWLYEQRLGWLEQTNLIDEKLKAYQTALARFQSRTWQDKLARFFLREKRNDDFSKFSVDLIGKLDDVETANYLSQFTNSSANEFDKQIRFKLYDAAHKRFPHNTIFITGLLQFYKAENRQTEWRELCATHYFESPEIRKLFLEDLASNGEIRDYLQKAKGDASIYELFRADASAHLSNYENAVAAYRKLNRIYPNSPEFAERLINFTRSFGQENRAFLTEASTISKAQADFEPSSAVYRTRSGEIFAELGDYKASNEEWQKLIALGAGDKETYLNAATLYWDYFQYSDAISTIKTLRGKFGDDTLYAFETGTILEAQGKKPESIREYVKALDAKSDEAQKEKAKTQLAYLIRKSSKTASAGANKTAENQASKMIQAAFADERAARYDASFLVLGYAEFLMRIKRGDEAAKLLNATITQSQNKRFLEAAKDFYETEKISSGEQIALKRLAETTSNPRQAIQYNLDLAENFEENQDRNAAKNVMAELVRKYPTNFGVLS